VGCPHAPPVQLPLQQSLAVWHAPPDARHVGAPHAPAVHVLLQQSLACAQPWPTERQMAAAQTPATHDSLQQSVYWAQPSPAVRHLPAGTGVFASPESSLLVAVIMLAESLLAPPLPESPASSLNGSVAPDPQPPNSDASARATPATHACVR
jgi:hypothetical protein